MEVQYLQKQQKYWITGVLHVDDKVTFTEQYAEALLGTKYLCKFIFDADKYVFKLTIYDTEPIVGLTEEEVRKHIFPIEDLIQSVDDLYC